MLFPKAMQYSMFKICISRKTADIYIFMPRSFILFSKQYMQYSMFKICISRNTVVFTMSFLLEDMDES